MQGWSAAYHARWQQHAGKQRQGRNLRSASVRLGGDAPQGRGPPREAKTSLLAFVSCFFPLPPPCSSSGVCSGIRYPFTSSTRRITPDWKSRVRGEKTWGHSFEPAMQRFLSRLLPAGAISPLAQVTYEIVSQSQLRVVTCNCSRGREHTKKDALGLAARL